MSHTPEQRTARPLCGARRRNGESCRAFAGQGTDHPGYGKCKYHGGSTKTHRVAAAKAKARKDAVAFGFGSVVPMEPVEALLWMVHLSAGQVYWLQQQIELKGPRPGLTFTETESVILYRLFSEERDRLARMSKAALDAGVAERAVRLAERTGAAIAEVLQRVFGDPVLGLNPRQRRTLPELLAKHMSSMERAPGEVAVRNGH